MVLLFTQFFFHFYHYLDTCSQTQHGRQMASTLNPLPNMEDPYLMHPPSKRTVGGPG